MRDETNYIRLFSGRKFWPLDPSSEDVAIADIAHSLSHKCRYQGHTVVFYSVAEHCVRLSWLASPENKLAALLHDAGEAYLPDVPRPIKSSLAGFKEIEERVDRAIFERYNLPYPWAEEINQLDTSILNDEMKAMLNYGDGPYGDGPIYPEGKNTRFGWGTFVAKEAFLSTFYNLTRREVPTHRNDLE